MIYKSPRVDDEKHDDNKHDDAAHADDGHSHAADGAHDSHADHKSAEDWTLADSMNHYLGTDHLIGHVQDSDYFELLGFHEDEHGHMVKNKLKIPQISPWTDESPLLGETGLIKTPENDFFGKATFQPTKFVVLELVGAIIVALLFIAYAKRVKNGDRPRGRFWNMIDAAVCYVRDEIATPGIGSADVKRFLPFVWTVFFYVLALNLIGMVPGLGAATGSISVTAAFALCVFFVVMGTGMKKMGVAGFLKAQAPHLDINPVLKMILLPMIWAIEVFGLFIKHVVLAVRLFANMFAGHLVVGVFIAFIGVTWGSWMVWGSVPVVILSTIAINLLELLVAFIQAYVFAFLTSLFIGAAIHPH